MTLSMILSHAGTFNDALKHEEIKRKPSKTDMSRYTNALATSHLKIEKE